uniref:Lanthionine synthetase C family protein n=1 Tax=Cyanothece sp. (strain PCC 7425 / ATCC 29141) TaxID=395961 RepID=B8HR22_CYAP4
MDRARFNLNIENSLNQIIANSWYFWEVLAADQSCVGDRSFDSEGHEATPQKLINQNLLDRWCQVTAEGNWEIFEKRLQWQGWDLHKAQTDTTATKPGQQWSPPDWSATLRQIMENAAVMVQEQSFSTFAPESCLSPDHPTPFAEVFLPCLQVARQQLLQQLAAAMPSDESPLTLLSNQAYLNLERGLLSELVNLWIRPLMQGFNLVRPCGEPSLSSSSLAVEPSNSKIYYEQFINQVLENGFVGWFEKYPVLGRLTATSINFWINSTITFLRHLQTDLAEIQAAFATDSLSDRPPANLGQVIKIEPCLSDRHEQGKTVISLTFASGLKLVYKPKNLDLDLAYSQFLSWCNQTGLSPSLKVLKVLSRNDHGWVEYVEHFPCADEVAAQRFYQRAGMLLCIIYLLRGTDCHYENLIASGEYPVLIDTETLLHPDVKPIAQSLEAMERQSTEQFKFWDSVLQTGLLPQWEVGKENSSVAYDMSGLGSSFSPSQSRQVQIWQDINTDRMRLEWQAEPVPPNKNVPILDGEPLAGYVYLDNIVGGFQQMYDILTAHQNELLGPSELLTEFQAKRVRFIFRPTQVYAKILHYSLSPKHLQSGLLRSISLDILSRPFLAANKKPLMWDILTAELQAIASLDIPYFACSSDTTTLSVGVERPIAAYFFASSYELVRNRFASLKSADRAYQTSLIRGAFYARVAQSTPSPGDSKAQAFPLPDDFKTVDRLNQQKLLAEAVEIATEIKQNALWEEDGSVDWIGLTFLTQSNHFQFQPLGDSLYHGRCGIALFLAALDLVSETQQYRDLVMGCLKPGRSLLCHSPAALTYRYLDYMGLGGSTGLGSILYAWVRLSQFLQQPDLVEDALRASNLITPELIQADTSLDLVAGVAGTILGLLALYHATDDPTVLARAIACGQHLCQTQIKEGTTAGGWVTLAQKRPLTGLSHGAAGIAYALLQLYHATDNPTYLQAAQQGIAYEQRVFNPQVGNWPDFRSGTEENPQFMVSWCHGAAGIGLARLGGLDILDTPEIRQDIENALETTQKSAQFRIDHLCCGTMGRIETMLVAAQKLARPELMDSEFGKVTWVVNRAKAEGTYQLFSNIPNAVFNPVFALGTAGIGYQLLRLAYSDQLPSLLIWQ